jgi:23S rRNA (uridine2552-2'-O)-methyltransferase
MVRKSQSRWLEQHKRDHFYRTAKRAGYRSRAAYKLKQINKKFNIISRDDTIVDLGAAPGGWSQVAYEIMSGSTLDEDIEEIEVKGKVIAVDLINLKPIDGVTIIRGDITNESTIEKILKYANSVNVVISDMSPDITGHYSVDQARSAFLAEKALELAKKILKPGGNFVVKVFQGEDFQSLLKKVKANFRFCKTFSPKASRMRSSEVYVVAKGFIGN